MIRSAAWLALAQLLAIAGASGAVAEGAPARAFTGATIHSAAGGAFVRGVIVVEDGKIAEVWLTYDRLGMLQQLGVIEPPAE